MGPNTHYLNTRMKQSTYILLGAAAAMLALGGCRSFEEINTNQQGVTVEMSARDGIAVGGPIQALQRQVVPVGTAADGTDIINNYQVAYHLGPDVWSGYFGQNNNWNSGNNFTTFYMMDGWLKQAFVESYTKTYAPWLTVKNHPSTEAHPENFALAQILKVSAWSKTTDCYGPIPYTKAGSSAYVIPYDSQEVVYKSMLKDLEDAVQVLTNYGGDKLLASHDLIYDGDTQRWIKYANSLMLRLAMHCRFADAGLAQTYAEKAVNHPIGVMSDVKDEAKIGTAHGVQYINNIETFAVQYNECRMGVPIFSYLMGYEDPRLPKYFLPSENALAIEADFAGGKYWPYPIGSDKPQEKPEARTASAGLTSLPNIQKETPTYWMRASEVAFLRAEGALIGWSMKGSAEDLYRLGIELSFKENGIDVSQVEPYMTSGKTPVPVDMSGWWPFYHTFEMKSTATTAFEGSEEEKLEKIITQKWIALYPNGMEAWTEWRRTGYPYIANPATNRSNGIVSDQEKVRRLSYPIKSARSEDDEKVYQDAVTLLGGPDNQATKLWWDKKNSK